MITAPIFKITDLHIRGLRGLQKLNLPQDGMGWENGFPPVSVIGGANGSGKSTLLRCIAGAARSLVDWDNGIPHELDAKECRIDFHIHIAGKTELSVPLRFLVGNEHFVASNSHENRFGYRWVDSHRAENIFGAMSEVLYHSLGRRPIVPGCPHVVFFPSDNRDLVVYQQAHHFPGVFSDDADFVVQWQRDSRDRRSKTLLEVLFAARWADLNAKDQGKPEEANNFERYTNAFTDLTLGEKRLVWTTKGELVVEIKGGAQHALQELSSGERQAFLLLAELRRFWKPGSLILIDELELHLHDAWQGKLYDVIKSMQAELGGQVIITTQSHSLFEMADLGTRALLGRGSLR